MEQQNKSYIGQYGYDPTQQMQDMDTLESTNKYGLSYERVEDPDATGRNITSIFTQGQRSGNAEQGGGPQKQGTIAESAISNFGGIDTRARGGQSKLMDYVSAGSGGGGANYEEIAKTGTSIGATAMDWIQQSKAQDVEQFQKELDSFLQNQYDADNKRQNQFEIDAGLKQQAIGQKQEATQRSWDQELLRMNDLMNIASQLRSQAGA